LKAFHTSVSSPTIPLLTPLVKPFAPALAHHFTAQTTHQIAQAVTKLTNASVAASLASSSNLIHIEEKLLLIILFISEKVLPTHSFAQTLSSPHHITGDNTHQTTVQGEAAIFTAPLVILSGLICPTHCAKSKTPHTALLAQENIPLPT
jgi:hypothetical protein